MNFETITEIKAGSGNPVKIGWCDISGERFKCVEKTYIDDDYNNVVNIFETFKEELKDIGPDLIWKNDKDEIIYLEYIQSQTVHDFVQNIDLSSDQGIIDYENLMKEVSNLLKTLNDRGLCHNDLHDKNVLVRDDMKLKIIDIDGMESKSKDNDCYDESELVGQIKNIIRCKISNKLCNKLTKFKNDLRKEYLNELEETMDKIKDKTPDELKNWFVYTVPKHIPF